MAEAEAEVVDPGLQRRRRRYEQARVGLSALAALVAAVTLAVSLVLMTRIADIAEVNQVNGEQVKDCTDPAGQCFRRGQEQTGRAVASIVDAQIAAVACSREPAAESAAKVAARNAAIKACVAAVLTPPPR